MIRHAEAYYSVDDYAKLCRVSPRNIKDRIRAGSVHFKEMDGFYFINAHLSPPVKRMNPAKRAAPAVAPPLSFSFTGLREVGAYAGLKYFVRKILYEAIVIGKLDGYVIGDKVFIKPEEAELLLSKK